MAKKKKKYNPQKEIASITGSMVGVSLGTNIAYSITTPISTVAPAVSLMGNIPVVQAGGSVIRSLDMLGNTSSPKRRKRKR